MRPLVDRLREVIISDAYAEGQITDYALAERLIRERLGAADKIVRMMALLEDIRPWVSNARDCPAMELIERIDAERKDD